MSMIFRIKVQVNYNPIHDPFPVDLIIRKGFQKVYDCLEELVQQPQHVWQESLTILYNHHKIDYAKNGSWCPVKHHTIRYALSVVLFGNMCRHTHQVVAIVMDWAVTTSRLNHELVGHYFFGNIDYIQSKLRGHVYRGPDSKSHFHWPPITLIPSMFA